MRVMVFVKANNATEKGLSNTPAEKKMMADMEKFNDELRNAGVMVMAEGLRPSKDGKRVLFDGPNRKVSEGPFTPAEELVAGFWIWEVKDMNDAVAWVKRCPNPHPGGGSIAIEIREIGD